MKLALKIDIASVRGTREGAPRLAALLEQHAAQASFLFTLGAARLLDCAWLPGKDLGGHCAGDMRAIRDAGFETGIHALDHARWQRNAAYQGADWTTRVMQRACERYQDIFGESAAVHGAAGWQMSVHAYRLTQRLGFRYCSDTRGSHPFVPVLNAEVMACAQFPTTLPTLDEVLATPGVGPDGAVAHLLRLSESPPPTGHVYTLRGEMEGLRHAALFESLLRGWQAQGYRIVALRDYVEALDVWKLPRHNVLQGHVAGRGGTVALQGGEFLA